jgi:hypothetical protein
MKAVAAVAGLLMVAAASTGVAGWALWLVGSAAILVLIGALAPRVGPLGGFVSSVRSAAVIASLALLALGTPSVPVSASAGLAAVGYLLAAYADPPAVQPMTVPTVASSVGFAAVAVLAASVPLEPAWIPLAAPVLVALLYAGAMLAICGASQS